MPVFSADEGLIDRYLEGLASAEEVDQLEAKLADREFADHFSRVCLLHRQIAELMREHELHALMDQFVARSPSHSKHALPQFTSLSTRRTAFDRSKSRSILSHRAGWGILAASVFAAAIWWIIPEQAAGPTPAVMPSIAINPQKPPQNPADDKLVATLTQVEECIWAAGAPALHHGQQLNKGDQVALESGMVKVTFDCGAEVVLEGPCDFWLHSSMIGYLTHGKITANVPRAFSFAILSPQVDFVDLGTSFGINVETDGRTELHVFAGEVLCSPAKRKPTDPNDVIHVPASKAMEFGSAPKAPSDIAINEGEFSRLISLRHAPEFKSRHLVEDQLALWLAADVAVTTDPKQRVIAWRDIVYGDNISAEDAIQQDEAARPLLVADGLNGLPAIRFDGKSDFLLTTPLETTDDQTVLFVCQFSPSALDKGRQWGGQIINYDGPPSRYLSDTLEPGVLQIGEPLLETQFKPTLLTGQVFAGFIGSATVEVGRVDAEPMGTDRPLVVSYVYDYEYGKGRSELVINGRSYGESKAYAPQGITSRKIIGRHAWMQNFFPGDLAELLIFNKVLSPEELAETTAFLAEKYAIPLTGEAEK